MRLTLPVALALSLAFLVATTAGGRAQDDDDTTAIDDTPHITLVDTATRDVAPDLAVITLGVSSRKPTAKAAADATAASAQGLVDAAKAQGVAGADIQTQSVTLAQAFEDEHDAQGRTSGRKPAGFDASNTIAIRVRDLGKAGVLAQSLIDAGATSFDGIVFTIEHPQQILDALAAEAVANARRQAQMVAQAAGVKLGRVLLIERPGLAPRPAPMLASPMARMATAAPKAMPVEAGTQGLGAEMEVTWAIDQS